MKYNMVLLIIVMCLMSVFANAQDRCEKECTDIHQDVNTQVPESLEGATIIVRTKDGKETTMKAEEFKVVKRQQQFKVKERVIVRYLPVPQDAIDESRALFQSYVDEVRKANKLNVISLGLSYDYVGLDSRISGNRTTLYSEKGTVFDLSYFRRRVLDTDLGLGIGINTNGSPRAVVGLEF